MKPAPSPLSGDLVGVYRTLPARIIGWVLVAGAALLATLTVVDVVAGRHVGAGLAWPLALVVGLGSGAWALFLRPHVRVYDDGVVLANVVTDSVVPLAVVEEVTHQWALELHDREGHRHSAWAVPVRRDRVRRRSLDDFAETTRRRGSAGVTAQGVADVVLRTLQRFRLDGGELRDDGAGTAAVVQRVAWSAVTALGLALALGVVALLG
ncbi:hypothetical protein ACI3ET_08070 [Ornithinimicrobium sp. LYQ121]|uniref:hypothetical protein n=1 Tax=Ornithinimicrobium sp. LYQ121 TaxID=3378801 RepID=UPI003851EB06